MGGRSSGGVEEVSEGLQRKWNQVEEFLQAVCISFYYQQDIGETHIPLPVLYRRLC